MIRDEHMPVGMLKKIDDFLPPPEALAVSEETVKVTIALSKESVAFFKRYAQQYHTKYQRMIRKLIDRYAQQYS